MNPEFENVNHQMITLIVLPILSAVLFFCVYLESGPATKHGLVLIQRNDNRLNLVLAFTASAEFDASPHYTEHLTWLPNIGKNSRPEGRDTNAWTNDYAVGYWLSGPPEDLPDMLRRLKVVFDPIDLPQAFAETERDIILREYDLRVA
jgi:hypothetical protein